MYKLCCPVMFAMVFMSSSVTDVYEVPTVCLGLENRNTNRAYARKGSWAINGNVTSRLVGVTRWLSVNL